MHRELAIFVQIYHKQVRKAAGLLTIIAVIFVTKSGCLDKLVSMMPVFGHIFTPGKYVFTVSILTLFFFAFLLCCFHFITLSEGMNDLKY